MLLDTFCIAASLLGLAQGATILTQASSSGNTTGSACACAALAQAYPNSTLQPLTLDYISEATHYWSTRDDLAPKCIFTPSDNDAVAQGLQILQKCQSQFALRSAGHMPVLGAANTDGGVLVVMTKFTQLQISSDNSTVTVGAGNTWYDVASYLEPYGRVAIGGRLKTIGVSGLTLGGGIHYFINKYGFAMDNVVSYTVVLVNGQTVSATANSYSDLFWALKGAGLCTFGIVTAFELKAHYIPQVSTQIATFESSSVPGFFKAVTDLAEAEDGIAAGGVFIVLNDVLTGAGTPTMLGVQEGVSNPPSQFANFSALPHSILIDQVETYASFTSLLDTPYQTSRYLFGEHVVAPNATNLLDMYNMYVAALPQMIGVLGFQPTFVTQNVNRGATAVSANNGIGNTWSLDDSKAYIFWQITVGWDLASDDAKVLAWQEAILEKIHSANLAKGLAIDFSYVNDAADFQDPLATLPAANLARLKTIRQKYDPNLVFTKLATGGFKLPA